MQSQARIAALATALVATLLVLGFVVVAGSTFGRAEAQSAIDGASYLPVEGTETATADLASEDTSQAGVSADGTPGEDRNDHADGSDGADSNDNGAGNADNGTDNNGADDVDQDTGSTNNGEDNSDEADDSECPEYTIPVGDECVPVIVDCISGYIWDGNECVEYCPDGTGWNGSECVGTSILCAPGYELVGDECVEIVCPDGTFPIGNTCEIVCVLTHHVVDGECVPFCFFGEDPDTGECLPADDPVFCLVGYEWVSGYGCLAICDDGFIRFGPTCIKIGIVDDLVLEEFDPGLIDPSIIDDLVQLGPIVDPALLESLLAVIPGNGLVLGDAVLPGNNLVLGQAVTPGG